MPLPTIPSGAFVPSYAGRSGLFLCLGGTAEVLVNDGRYTLRRGTLYVISPLVSISRVSQSPDFRGIHVLHDQDVIYPVIHTIIPTILRLKLRHNPCLQADDDAIALIRQQRARINGVRRQLRAAASPEARTVYGRLLQLIAQETMLHAVTLYFRHAPAAPQPVERAEAVVYQFVRDLHHPADPAARRSVAHYAARANLSAGHFAALIRQHTGRTPSQWMADVTIADAKHLLTTTRRSVKEIAAQLAFPEQYTFGKYFKLHTGLSPKNFRLMHQKQQTEKKNVEGE